MATAERTVLITLPKTFEEVSYLYLKERFEKEGVQIKGFCNEESPDHDKLLSLVRDVDGYITGWSETIDESVINNANRLKVITEFGVGVEHIDLDACTKKNIIVGNTPGVNADAVKELTIGLILSLARGICKINENTKKGRWELVLGTQLKNRVLGVIGTGNIGRRVSKVAMSLEMKVLAYDIQKNKELIKETKVEYLPLEEIFRQADFITIHIPLTAETRHLINKKYLNLMKKSAYLINTSRGPVIDEDYLYEILKDKKIAGAGLDVFSIEPPTGSPLLQLDNVVATSHIAGSTYEALRDTAQVNFEDIIRTFKGGKPSHVVNPRVFDS